MNKCQINILHGDCLDRLKEMESESFDAVIGDPPYDIAFMSKDWDDNNVLLNDKIWRECFRVLKPGGIIKQFSASRTYHRLCRTFRKVGFREVTLQAWTYGSGFPKSTNISKKIDHIAGAERKVIGYTKGVGGQNLNDIVNGKKVRQTTDEGGKGVGAYGTGAKQVSVDIPITEPATAMAKTFVGYGTALKPGCEPIVCGRKFK